MRLDQILAFRWDCPLKLYGLGWAAWTNPVRFDQALSRTPFWRRALLEAAFVLCASLPAMAAGTLVRFALTTEWGSRHLWPKSIQNACEETLQTLGSGAMIGLILSGIWGVSHNIHRGVSSFLFLRCPSPTPRGARTGTGTAIRWCALAFGTMLAACTPLSLRPLLGPILVGAVGSMGFAYGASGAFASSVLMAFLIGVVAIMLPGQSLIYVVPLATFTLLRLFYLPLTIALAVRPGRAAWYRLHPLSWDRSLPLSLPSPARLLREYCLEFPSAGRLELNRLRKGTGFARRMALSAEAGIANGRRRVVQHSIPVQSRPLRSRSLGAAVIILGAIGWGVAKLFKVPLLSTLPHLLKILATVLPWPAFPPLSDSEQAIFQSDLAGLGKVPSLYFFAVTVAYSFLVCRAAFAGTETLALLKFGRRLMSIDFEELLQRDSRSPILYLRTFAHDTENGPFELAMTAALSDVGPIIAIGKPGEIIPPLGVSRVYVGTDWQQCVAHLAKQAQLIVLRLGDSAGIRWEFEYLIDRVDHDKLILVCDRSRWLNEQSTTDHLSRFVSVGEKGETADQDVVMRISSCRSLVHCDFDERLDHSSGEDIAVQRGVMGFACLRLGHRAIRLRNKIRHSSEPEIARRFTDLAEVPCGSRWTSLAAATLAFFVGSLVAAASGAVLNSLLTATVFGGSAFLLTALFLITTLRKWTLLRAARLAARVLRGATVFQTALRRNSRSYRWISSGRTGVSILKCAVTGIGLAVALVGTAFAMDWVLRPRHLTDGHDEKSPLFLREGKPGLWIEIPPCDGFDCEILSGSVDVADDDDTRGQVCQWWVLSNDSPSDSQILGLFLPGDIGVSSQPIQIRATFQRKETLASVFGRSLKGIPSWSVLGTANIPRTADVPSEKLEARSTTTTHVVSVSLEAEFGKITDPSFAERYTAAVSSWSRYETWRFRVRYLSIAVALLLLAMCLFLCVGRLWRNGRRSLEKDFAIPRPAAAK